MIYIVTKYYHKLVRDKIPEIIESEGKECKYTIIKDDDEYRKKVFLKFEEEFKELQKAKYAHEIAEELADVLELVHTLADIYNVDMENVKHLMNVKSVKKGRFIKKVFLHAVTE